jgi:heme/copper-type cytochrome/quinol oxidase subunit 3
MADMATEPSADMAAEPSAEAAAAAEEESFYHESALNATWAGSRLAIGGLSFLFGCFAFAYFYLRSLNSSGRWQGHGFVYPSFRIGTAVMAMVLLSAGANYFGLQRIKAGSKVTWQVNALAALVLGLAAVALQIYQLADLPFKPGSSGFASVFTGFYPVLVVIVLAAMIWLETLLARSRFIPALSFVEQPPTYTETYSVQRFQASLSGFSTIWNYLALVAFVFWFLFYAL